MQALLEASVAPATARVYNKYVDKYLTFSTTLETSAAPFHHSLVEMWLASLSNQHLSYSSIQSHLSALRHHVNKLGLIVDLNTPRIRMILKGIKRSTPASLVLKNAMTLSHLRRLCSITDSLMLKSMFTLAFFGFLRVSELCMSSSKHHLLRGSIKLGRTGSITLKFASFKHSKQPVAVKVRSFKDVTICPWRALHTYLSSAKLVASSPLYDMTTEQFRNKFQELCNLAKIKTKLTPHSFRHGGATWAASECWPDVRIRAHGRWSSDAYKKYVRPL